MSNKPFNFFYGWWNVATGFVGMGLSYAMFTVFVFGTFVGPLQAEFGWTRAELSFALSMTNIAIVIASPCVGLVIDRFGVKRTLIPSLIMMGIVVGSMSLLSENIWHYYALYFLIPFLGAGSLPQSFSRVLIAWFAKRRGIALGISLSGFGVGAALIPYYAQLMIDSYGWRMAYVGFMIAIFCVSLPMTIFLLKEKPEELGLRADGNNADDDDDLSLDESIIDPNSGMTASAAAKTKNYWLILFSFMLVGVGITSVLAHLVPMLIDRGIAPQKAAWCMTSLGLGLIFGRIFAGYLMDRFFAPYVTAAFLLGLIIGIMILASGTSSVLVFVAAILVGMATGSEISEIAYICSRYFGQKAFGQIYGFMFSAFQLGSAFGAPLLGAYYDKVGDYIGALWLVAAVVFIGTILIIGLSPYPQRLED